MMKITLRIITVLSVFSAMPLPALQPLASAQEKANPAAVPGISNSQMESLANIFRRFNVAGIKKDEKQEAEAAKELLALDTDNMPEELRHAVVEEQLDACKWIGDWKSMVSIKVKLMNKQRNSKTDHLCDADLLKKISGYYCGNPIFSPPKELQQRGDSKKSFKLEFEYSEKHYEDAKEEERVLRYIVNAFDPNYAPVFHARSLLAGALLNLGKPAESLEFYLKCDEQDPTKLYCLPKANICTGEIISAKDVMEEYRGLGFVCDQKSFDYSEILRVSLFLPNSKREEYNKGIETLRLFRKRHLNDPKLRASLEARLRELSLKSDLILPAEELGLPKITSKTAATSSTLPAAKSK